jgi:hypothetical protein
MAYVEGDTAGMLRAVSVGTELLKTFDLEEQVAELRALVVERVPGAAGRLGATS